MLRATLTLPIVTLAAAPALGGVIVNIDFDSVPISTIANNTTLNSGGTATDDLVVINQNASNVVEVVGVGAGSDRELRYTRTVGSTGTDMRLINRDDGNVGHWSAVSTGATGENQLRIVFDVNRLNTSSATPGLRLLLNDGVDTSDARFSAVDFQIRRDGQVRLNNGDIQIPTTDLLLALNTNYRITIDVDLSNELQDTHRFSVMNLDTATTVYTHATAVNTRAPNVRPDRLVFALSDIDGTNALPVYRLDNISVTSSLIPEPASVALLVLGGAVMLGRGRRLA